MVTGMVRTERANYPQTDRRWVLHRYVENHLCSLKFSSRTTMANMGPELVEGVFRLADKYRVVSGGAELFGELTGIASLVIKLAIRAPSLADDEEVGMVEKAVSKMITVRNTVSFETMDGEPFGFGGLKNGTES